MEQVQSQPARKIAAPPTSVADALSAVTIARSVTAGELTAEEVTAAHLRRIAEMDPSIRSLNHLDAERALGQARKIDQRRGRGKSLGALAGVPVVIKDNIDVRRQTTSSGSRAHGDVLALRDAPLVSRLRDAGAVLLGRANMDELAMGASTQTSAFGATRNPWDLRRSPGGSSGGCAAAVAAGLAALSVGTDTGGSIREPAAQCGVVGMAPSPGLVPMAGIVPFAPTLDRAGPLARTVAEAALLLAVMSGQRELAAAGRVGKRGGDVTQLRVGVIEEFAGVGNQFGVLARLALTQELLAELGVPVTTVSLPDAARGLQAYMRITSAACVPLFEPYVRTGQAGEEVQRRYEVGQMLRTEGKAELAEAYTLRQRLAAQVRNAFAYCDVLLSPTMPTIAPLLFDETPGMDGVMVEELADPMAAPYTDCWTVLANLAGTPSLSVPAGCSTATGMPVGVMLSGQRGADADLLRLGAALEDAGLAAR